MKVVSVTNGDYKVKVQSGGNIFLDTGNSTGTVHVSGDLVVHGDQTVVNSETMTVTDNIVILNNGETGNGVTLITSGIQIDRGNLPDAAMLFNESVNHVNSSGVSTPGTFVFQNTTGTLVGIQAISIGTGGNDLFLINTGTGVVSVAGTTNYEAQVTDDDDIPNKKYVDDRVTTVLASWDDFRILEGDTKVETHDLSAGDGPSRITFNVDGTERAQINVNGLNVNNLRLLTNTVSNTNASANLILTATNGNVEVDGVLNLKDRGSDAAAAAGYGKLYAKATSGAGDTGVYFANNRDTGELVSKKRALVFSVIF